MSGIIGYLIAAAVGFVVGFAAKANGGAIIDKVNSNIKG